MRLKLKKSNAQLAYELVEFKCLSARALFARQSSIFFLTGTIMIFCSVSLTLLKFL